MANGDLAARLVAFGRSLLTFLFASDHVALDRMLPHELAHHPGMAHRFFAAGPGKCREVLAAMLEQAAAEGQLDLDDSTRAAEDLMALWKGFTDVELKFGVRERMTDADIDARVRHGTGVFLKAYRPLPQGGGP